MTSDLVSSCNWELILAEEYHKVSKDMTRTRTVSEYLHLFLELGGFLFKVLAFHGSISLPRI